MYGSENSDPGSKMIEEILAVGEWHIHNMLTFLWNTLWFYYPLGEKSGKRNYYARVEKLKGP